LTTKEKELINIINEIKPDIIFVTGDYFNGSIKTHPEGYKSARYVLENISAPLGIFATSSDATKYSDHEKLFEWLPIIYLKNENYKIELKNDTLYIAGIDRIYADIDKTFEGIPDNSNLILLSHGPEVFYDEELEKYKPDLIFVGHTHGGQIAFPIIGPLTSATPYGPKLAKGWFEREGMKMYVNRGVGLEGFGAPKIRFLTRPEVAVIQISKYSNIQIYK